MGNVSKKEKILLLVLLIAAIVFVYIQFYLPSQNEKIDSLNTSISDENNQLDNLNTTLLVDNSLKNKLDGLDAKYNTTLSQFPSYGKVPTIAINIQDFCNKAGITLSSITLGDAQLYNIQNSNGNNTSNSNNANNSSNNNTNNNGNNNDNNNTLKNSTFTFYTIPTTISVTGEYERVKSFLAEIENDTRLAKVETISITRGDSDNVTASLLVSYYYVPGVVLNYDSPTAKADIKKDDMFK